VKFLPTSDETSITNNLNGTSPDNEQLSREDFKFSGKICFEPLNKFQSSILVKIFLRSLEPELLSHTIETGFISFILI
jgi:hypothetical protein